MSFLTLPRLINYFLVACGYLLSRILRRPFHFGKPPAVSVEPTNRCNLHCPECPSGLKELSRERGSMDLELFRSAIDQLSPELAWLTLYFQGEPYLSPVFFEMVKYARSRSIFVSTSTNGHFLDTLNTEATVVSGLNRLIVSVDGTDQETYEKYRVGGSLRKVIEGIENLSNAKKKLQSNNPEIILQFLVLGTNEHQVNDIRRQGKKWGADKVVLKSAQFYEFEQGNPLMPAPGRYSRYKAAKPLTNDTAKPLTNDTAKPQTKDSAKPQTKDLRPATRYRIKNTLPNHCFRMWSQCVITWDGKIVPCCFDKDAHHEMGDLAKRSFMDIWTSETYNDFRQRILKDRKSIIICSNCTEGTGSSRWI